MAFGNSYSKFGKDISYTEKDRTRDLISAIIYLIVVIGIMTIAIPWFSNLGPGLGATERVNIEKFWWYVGPGVGFGLIIFAIKITRWATKGKHKWLDVFIFDPENSFFYRIGLFKGTITKFIIIFLVFLALAGALAIGGGVSQSSYWPNTNVPDVMVEQTAWKTPSELGLSVYPA